MWTISVVGVSVGNKFILNVNLKYIRYFFSSLLVGCSAILFNPVMVLGLLSRLVWVNIYSQFEAPSLGVTLAVKVRDFYPTATIK